MVREISITSKDELSEDQIDKINFSKLEKVSQYVFLTAWELANRKESLK